MKISISRATPHLATIAVLVLGTMLSSAASAADDFPTQPITLVVPFAAGGGTDNLARLIADGMSERLGQPVVVENRPGAGSLIGVTYVANAEPDGYTLLMASSSFVTNVVLGEDQPYDPLTALEPITLVSMSPNVLVVNPSVEPQTVEELVAEAKARPGEYTFATYGDRSTAHLAGVLFGSEAGIDIQGVPYGGGGPAVTATLSGETDMVMSTIMLVQPQIEAGNLVPLALAADQRNKLIPDVPTFEEAGIPFEIGTWFGIAAPAGTPEEITSKVNAAVVDYINTAEMTARIEGEGSILMALELDEFGDFIESEVEQWTRVREQGLLD